MQMPHLLTRFVTRHVTCACIAGAAASVAFRTHLLTADIAFHGGEGKEVGGYCHTILYASARGHLRLNVSWLTFREYILLLHFINQSLNQRIWRKTMAHQPVCKIMNILGYFSGRFILNMVLVEQ